MKFTVPDSIDSFEIPDEWWQAGNIGKQHLMSTHFEVEISPEIFNIPISSLIPPKRDNGMAMFPDGDRVINLLNGMRNGDSIPPIMLWSKKKMNSESYMIRDGMHRFYLSIALGFTEIPALIDDNDNDEFLAKEAADNEIYIRSKLNQYSS